MKIILLCCLLFVLPLAPCATVKSVGAKEGKYCDSKAKVTTAPDPNDCGSFYHCLDNKYFHLQCVEGLIFNTKAGYCDYNKDNVKCTGE
jgi:hypothetical protein